MVANFCVKDLIDVGVQNADIFFTPINSLLSNIGQDNKSFALNICVDTDQIKLNVNIIWTL